MVFAAPLFLFAQTRKLRSFVLVNAAGFQLMGVSVLAAYAASRALAASYEAERVRGELDDARADLAAAIAAAGDDAYLVWVLRAASRAASSIGSRGVSRRLGHSPAQSAAPVTHEDELATTAAPLLRDALEATVAEARAKRACERALSARAEAAFLASAELCHRVQQGLTSGSAESITFQAEADQPARKFSVSEDLRAGSSGRVASSSESESMLCDRQMPPSSSPALRGFML